MARTFIAADPKRAPANSESRMQNKDEQRPRDERRQLSEQSQNSQNSQNSQGKQGMLALFVAPLVLAAVAGTAVLALRRLLNDDRGNGR